MTDDLPPLLRAVYSSNLRHRRTMTEAFEEAVEILMRRRPLLSPEEARQETAMTLGIEEPASRNR